ncbi:MAG: WYL domain-containing protein [Pseudomonadota bacterium]
MPRKLAPYKTYGQKLVTLFAKLLFSGESYSLTELSAMLGCSKQTILRLVEDIRRSYGVSVTETREGNRKYFRIRRFGGPPAIGVTSEEMQLLLLCRAFAENLLGRELFDEAARALEKGRALVQGDGPLGRGHFASFRPGSIDYTPHRDTIRELLDAMGRGLVCRILYRSLQAARASTFFVMPLKLFSHHDAMYLHGRLATRRGGLAGRRAVDLLFAVHRIEEAEATDAAFSFPADYDFEKAFNAHFGLIKAGAFEVEVELSGFAASYVAERVWSPDQKLVRKKGGRARLAFTASSKPEVIGWVLSFGAEARLIRPDGLASEIAETVTKMKEVYAQVLK